MVAGAEEVSPHVIKFLTPLAQSQRVMSMQEELARLCISQRLNSPNIVPTPTRTRTITVLTNNSGHFVFVFSPTRRHVCCYHTASDSNDDCLCTYCNISSFAATPLQNVCSYNLHQRECQNITLAPSPLCLHRRTQKMLQTFYFTITPNLLRIRDRELERGILASQLLVDRCEGLQLVLHISAVLGI